MSDGCREGLEAESILALDRLAAKLVALAPELAYRNASSAGDREAYYRLRYETVIEQGWARAEDLPGGIERDEFDERAAHVLGWFEGKPVAGMRIVYPQPGLPLPTEQEFGLRVEPAGGVVNLDRMLVARSYSGPRVAAFQAMLGVYWQAIRGQGYTTSAGILSPIMLRLYRRLGFDPQVLAPPKRTWGQLRYPVRVSAADASTGSGVSWRERWLEQRREREAARRRAG